MRSPTCSCPFPSPADRRARTTWTCPRCMTQYRLTKPKPRRWWRRRWDAPDGYWRVRIFPVYHASDQLFYTWAAVCAGIAGVTAIALGVAAIAL